MSRKAAPGTLIHCEYCGEDYSATYKRCPFCGEKPSADAAYTPPPRPRRDLLEDEEDDGYVFQGEDLFDLPDEDEEEENERAPRPRGGKRLAQDSAPGPINWPRLITFICSLVMIAAALIIVFAYIYPKIHNPSNTPAAGNSDPDSSTSDAVSPLPEDTDEPDQTSDAPADPSPEPSEEPFAGVPGKVTGISSLLKIRSGPDSSYDKVASLQNNTAVTVLADAGNGWYKISFEDGGKTVTGYAKGDYLSFEDVGIPPEDGGEAQPSAEPSPTTAPSPSGSIPAGSNAVIAGASSGVNVRMGPGTSYDKIMGLSNGAVVVVMSEAEDGWLEISFQDEDGSTVTGYVLGQYVALR